MKKEYWAINFDLDTKEMEKSLGSATKGYRLLEKTFEEVGFIHRQGSGYISIDKIDKEQVDTITEYLAIKNKWLNKTVKTFDATIINEEKYSLVQTLKMTAEKNILQIKKSKNSAITFEDYLKQVKNKSKNNEFSR